MSTLEEVYLRHRQADEKRLDRIEEKIDRLADTVVAIARAEEKLVALEESRYEQAQKLSALEKKYDEQTLRVSRHEEFQRTITKLFWIVCTVAVTGIGGMLFVTGQSL